MFCVEIYPLQSFFKSSFEKKLKRYNLKNWIQKGKLILPHIVSRPRVKVKVRQRIQLSLIIFGYFLRLFLLNFGVARSVCRFRVKYCNCLPRCSVLYVSYFNVYFWLKRWQTTKVQFILWDIALYLKGFCDLHVWFPNTPVIGFYPNK